MQIVSMPGNADRTAYRKITIAVDIGRYHFINAEGWHEEWNTETRREWWQKEQWLKDGGWSQDESTDTNRHS